MLKTARTCADSKVVIDQHLARIDDLASAAAAVTSGGAAETIRRAKEPLRQAAGQMTTYAVLVAERTRWARIAASDPMAYRFLRLLDMSGDAYGAMLASAQSAEALQRFLSFAGKANINLALQSESIANMVRTRFGDQYAKTASVIDEIFKLQVSAAVRAEAIAAGGFTDYWAKMKGLEEDFKLLGKAGRYGGPLIDVILQAWSDADNPYLSSARRAERLAAAAAGGIAVGIIAGAVAGAACGAVSLGIGAIPCAIAVGGAVAYGGGLAVSEAINRGLPEDKTISWEKYQKEAEKARKKVAEDLESQYYTGNLISNEKYRPIMQGDGAPHDLEQLEKELRKEARKYAREQTGYPPRDPLARYYQEKFDRQEWSFHNYQIEKNK